jgi:hypothetical protein
MMTTVYARFVWRRGDAAPLAMNPGFAVHRRTIQQLHNLLETPTQFIILILTSSSLLCPR